MAAVDALLSLFPPGSALDPDGMLTIGGCRADALAAEYGTPVLVVAEGALRDAGARVRRRPRRPLAELARGVRVQGLPVHRRPAGDGRGGARPGRRRRRRDRDRAQGGRRPGAARPARQRQERRRDRAWSSSTASGSSSSTTPTTSTGSRRPSRRAGSRTCWCASSRASTADTHAHVLTGHEGSKFGLAPAAAAELIRRIERSPKLRMRGLHVHVGSQILDVEPFAASVAPLAALGEFPVYDLGGGLGARYSYDDHPPSVDDYLDALIGAAREHLPAEAELIIEPGRSMVALRRSDALPRGHRQARRDHVRRRRRRDGRQPRGGAATASASRPRSPTGSTRPAARR